MQSHSPTSDRLAEVPRMGNPIREIPLKIKRLHPEALLPQIATAGSACFDLHAITDKCQPVIIEAGESKIFNTGLAFAVPDGFVMAIHSRSGMGFKSDVRLANCVGIIDSDYRGEVMVKLTNDGDTAYRVKHTARIAQAMLIQVPRALMFEVDELPVTMRGPHGFGSTGA